MNTYIFDRLKKALRLGTIAFLLPLFSFLFTSCEDVPMPYNNPELPPEPEVVVIDPIGDGTKENPFNVAGVLEYIKALGPDVESTKDIYVAGVITSIKEYYTTQYGNATFVISDTDEGTNKFTFYRGLYLGRESYSNENDPNIKVDDVVVICGKVVNYGGSTPETVQKKAYLESLNGKSKDVDPVPTGTPKGSGTLEDPYNASGANAYITSLAADAESDKDIYIKGKISSIKEAFTTQYGNASFYISDDGDTKQEQFYVFRTLYLGNKKYEAGDQIKAGDEVIICGRVVNFKGSTPETAQNKSYLYSLNGKTDAGGGGTPDTGGAKGSGTQADPYNAAAANAFIASLAADTESDREIYVKGKIIDITEKNQFNEQYGNATFYISDDGTENGEKFYVFRTLYLGNEKYTGGDLPKKGDEVVICGKVINYKGNTPETVANKSYIYSLNGKTAGDGGDGGDTAAAGTTAENAFTPAEANAFIATLEADKNTEQNYYIKGKIIDITEKNQFNEQYGNATFYISDDGTEKDDKFYVFRTLYLGNVKYTGGDLPKKGDEVIICGQLVNYKGNTPETVANKSYIYSLNGVKP